MLTTRHTKTVHFFAEETATFDPTAKGSGALALDG